MVSKTLAIINEMGFHMRPANLFAAAMNKYPAAVSIEVNGKRIDGKSMMAIMASCIKKGMSITVECDGENEQAMLNEAVSLIESGFGE